MRRALLPPALLLLLAGLVSAAPYNFLDNYRDPTPSPQDGPPASSHASRDKSLLPAQICGIVGGYVATVLIWGILLLTVGRRMRRKTENSPRTLELQLVTKHPAMMSPTSPLGSARSVSSWRRFFRKEKDVENGDIPESSTTSPVVQSPGSFDQRIIDDNKARAQAEMERLYAAVMDHDRKKSMSQASVDSNEGRGSHRPSAINTRDLTSQSNPSSPVRAIYPPGYAANGPPTAPLPSDRNRPSSPRSILSKKSTTSSNSKRFNLKNLRISGPIQKYPGEPEEERTPLSPRYYHNPGAPPPPPTAKPAPQRPPRRPPPLPPQPNPQSTYPPLHPPPRCLSAATPSPSNPPTYAPQC